jgi:predicted NBD/HSP70 family sugar kinase
MCPPPSPETAPVMTPAASLVFTTLLSHGPLTRAETGRRTGLSPAAVTKAVRPLMELGYLVEGADEGARPAVGRPASLVWVDAGKALFIGIKVTGDEIIAVLADLCCRVRIPRHVRLTDREPEAVLPAVIALVQELLTEADGFGVPVRGLGIAVSGDVDRAHGTVRYSPFLEWRDVPLAEIVRTATGLPVTVDNDVRALTVAEHWFGAGVGLSDFALVTVGAGIGCGLVVHGRVVSGAHGVSGEIGHLSLDPLGPLCHCGNRGCVEAIAADPAILRAVRENRESREDCESRENTEHTDRPVTSAAEALELARGGDPGAREVYARAGEAIGKAIGSLVNLLGPERVIISGEGLAAYDLFADGIREAFAASAFGTASRCDVMTRPLPFAEWARGAAATAIQSFIGTDTYEEQP